MTKRSTKPHKEKGSKPKKIGRPSIYTEKLSIDICERLSKGEGLIKICRDDAMPHESTIYEWILDGKHQLFADRYARAREMQAERMAEEIIEISDEADKVVKSGAEKKSSAYSANQRLRVEARKWVAAKLLPKKYGDKVDLTSDNKPLKGNTIVLHEYGSGADGK